MTLEDDSLEADESLLPASDDTTVATTVDPTVDAVVDDAPAKTMEETLQQKYKELLNPDAGKEAKEDDGQPRRKDGTFDKVAKVKPAAASASGTPADGTPAAAAVATPAAVVTTVPGVEKAPTSWKGGAQAKYATLDPEIKAEIHRREADFHTGIAQYKKHAELGSHFEKEFAPYTPLINASGHTPQTLVRNWLNAEYTMKTGTPEQKAAMFVQYANAYGVDLNAVKTAQEKIAAGQPAVTPPDPQLTALQQEVAAIREANKAADEERKRVESAAITSEVETFAKDPANKHFETVRQDMSKLMQSGIVNSLQDAYNKACWANETVRNVLLTEQAEVRKAKAAERAAAAKKAAGANVNTRGTPPAVVKSAKGGTMDDTLKATYAALQAQGAA